jgi:hypothetical protein
MPVHDWTRVDAGIFHHFHNAWITNICSALNAGLLPPDYYALAEQIAGGLGPDVLTLRTPANGAAPPDNPTGGVALATAPPRVSYRARLERDQYAAKANAIVIRHISNHQVVAMLEIVSPGNKSSRNGLRAFVRKAVETLQAGIHLLIVDLFPPGPRDPQGIHRAIWDEIEPDARFVLPAGEPLTLASYIGGPCPEALVDFAAVGQPLPERPLFLNYDIYVPVPLESTYRAAYEGVPPIRRARLERP